MKLLKKVKSIEVKRCFVVSDFVSYQKYLKQPPQTKNKDQYLKQLEKAKRVILELPEVMLDMIIKGGYKKRFNAYNKMEWYLGTVKISEVGVWKRAGGLPLKWTHGSLEETVSFVRKALQKNSKQLAKRSKIAISGILKNNLCTL